PVALAERALASGRLAQGRAFAFFSAARVLLGAGELDALTVAVNRALDAARQAGDLPGAVALVQLRALVAAHSGDLVAAEGDVAESLELARAHGLANNVKFSGTFAVTVAVDRGRLVEVVTICASS